MMNIVLPVFLFFSMIIEKICYNRTVTSKKLVNFNDSQYKALKNTSDNKGRLERRQSNMGKF